MKRQILEQYVDACELMQETEAEIQKLKKQKRLYAAKIMDVSVLDFQNLDFQEQILTQRKADAEHLKQQVERWMNTIPQRMQRIIWYKIFNEMTWAQVAVRMGRRATADSVRAEFQRFIKDH